MKAIVVKPKEWKRGDVTISIDTPSGEVHFNSDMEKLIGKEINVKKELQPSNYQYQSETGNNWHWLSKWLKFTDAQEASNMAEKTIKVGTVFYGTTNCGGIDQLQVYESLDALDRDGIEDNDDVVVCEVKSVGRFHRTVEILPLPKSKKK